ncbi:hypothetical protein HELRODRAFT_167543 [Helobdella robusta]|uniref:Uncharacterized protein n=1 Tax=Helobdella robusta TaxID=6412 RepID=T1EZH0_HELRO|nr:hypothetical protein HELRODRAFT_167543 [Helobdella robusta]ESO11024.1 hypothetical protein HELRODRAFT_167543 [Helobdella robusta]
MNMAAEYLNENFIEEFPPPPTLTSYRLRLGDDDEDDDVEELIDSSKSQVWMNKRMAGDGMRKRSDAMLFSDCESSCEETLSGHSTVMFLTNETLQEIAYKLNKKNPFEVMITMMLILLFAKRSGFVEVDGDQCPERIRHEREEESDSKNIIPT